jgi:hypothetical protein
MAQDPISNEEYLRLLQRRQAGGGVPGAPVAPVAPGGPRTPSSGGFIEEETSTFGTLLDWLNRPANAVASGALASQQGGSFIDSLIRGFKGGDDWKWTVPESEQHNFAEVLENRGWKRTPGKPLSPVSGWMFS